MADRLREEGIRLSTVVGAAIRTACLRSNGPPAAHRGHGRYLCGGPGPAGMSAAIRPPRPQERPPRQPCPAAPPAPPLILLDTGPLVALCEPRDGLNRTALRDLDRIPLATKR